MPRGVTFMARWGLLMAGLLGLSGCGGGPRPAAPAGASGDRAGAVWVERPAPESVAQLAERGVIAGAICARDDGVWVLNAAPPVQALRLEWHCAGQRTPPLPGEEITPWADMDSPAANIERQVQRVLSALGEDGFALAGARLADFRSDSLLTLQMALEPGPFCRVLELRYAGNRSTRRSHLDRVAGWEGPRVYRESEWDRARQALEATRLFAEVSGPQIILPAAPAGDTIGVEVLLRVRERTVNHFNAVLGYANHDAGGLFGFVDLGLGNLFGTGRRAAVQWQSRSDSESRFRFEWREPYLWRLPLAAQLELTQVQEDTLYAESGWGGDLVWSPSPGWDVSVGWTWVRLVLEGEDARRRRTQRFAVNRRGGLEEGIGRGWRLRGEYGSLRDCGVRLRRGTLEARQWLTWGPLGIRLDQAAGTLAGSDSLLRADAFLLGGAASLRGSFEGAYRAFRYVVQRCEFGPSPGRPGAAWVYALLDVGWWGRWRAAPGSLYGRPAGRQSHWAAGVGVAVPTRAGELRLDYAVPRGAALARGRVHFGVEGRF